jgi:hypothetical protein
MKKLLAAIVLAAAAIAVPTPVAAVGYVPDHLVTVDGRVAPGAAIAVRFADSAFDPQESVVVRLDGHRGHAVVLASTRTRSTSASIQKTSSPTGALETRITLPADARDAYRVVATGQGSGNVASVMLTVVPDAAGADSGAGGSDESTNLAFTGAQLGTLGVVAAVLGLGGAVLGLLVMRRRTQHGRVDRP